MTNITKVPLSQDDKRIVTMNIAPISTVTWFSGDRTRAIDIIAERMNDVVAANPWLLGKLSKNHKGKMCICYDADIPRHELPARASHLVVDVPEPHPTVALGLPVSQDDKMRRTILLGHKRKDTREQFFKVAIIPCSKSPQDRFGVFVSMLHSVGDGNSFYRLYNMVLCEEKVQALNIHRVEGSFEKMNLAVGCRPMDHAKFLVGMAIGKLGYVANWRSRTVEKSFIVDSTKAKALKESEKGDCSFISTNDLIVSWLERCSESSYTHMPMNLRGRVADFTDDHVGNYATVTKMKSSARPDLVRMKVNRKKDERYPWASVFRHHLIITNWSSFPAEHTKLDGCDELLHKPNTDISTLNIRNLTYAVVYRPSPGKIAVSTFGSPERIGAVPCPVESNEGLHGN